MLENTSSAVTTIRPTRGRKPIVLKNGKTLSEARSEAKDGIRVAKLVLKEAKAGLKSAQARVNGLLRQRNKDAKALLKAEAALEQSPKDAQLKAAVKAAKATCKDTDAQIKAASKDTAAAEKVVAKAEADVTKAQDAALKVEALKLNA